MVLAKRPRVQREDLLLESPRRGKIAKFPERGGEAGTHVQEIGVVLGERSFEDGERLLFKEARGFKIAQGLEGGRGSTRLNWRRG